MPRVQVGLRLNPWPTNIQRRVQHALRSGVSHVTQVISQARCWWLSRGHAHSGAGSVLCGLTLTGCLLDAEWRRSSGLCSWFASLVLGCCIACAWMGACWRVMMDKACNVCHCNLNDTVLPCWIRDTPLSASVRPD